jgi:hypothetical protein
MAVDQHDAGRGDVEREAQQVANSRTVGKDEKSSGLAALSATISTARLIMMLAMKPMSSTKDGTGMTIRPTSIRVQSGRIALRPVIAHSLRVIEAGAAMTQASPPGSLCPKPRKSAIFRATDMQSSMTFA